VSFNCYNLLAILSLSIVGSQPFRWSTGLQYSCLVPSFRANPSVFFLWLAVQTILKKDSRAYPASNNSQNRHDYCSIKQRKTKRWFVAIHVVDMFLWLDSGRQRNVEEDGKCEHSGCSFRMGSSANGTGAILQPSLLATKT
jgi:hypothetical protein